MDERDLKVRAYGASGALTAEATHVEKNNDDPAFHTISLDVAQGQTPRFDWQNKLSIRLTAQELPRFLAVLLGWLPQTSGQHHGKMKDKGFELQHQGTKVFFKIMQKGAGVRAVPIGGPDLMALSALIIHQMRRNAPWLSSDSILQLVKSTVVRTETAPPMARAS